MNTVVKRQSFKNNLLNKLEDFNSKTCFIDHNEEKFSYKDIIKNSEIITCDLKPRSLVFNLTNNNIESLTSYVGFFRKGLVQLLLDQKINHILLQKLINTYSPDYIYLPNERIEEFKNYNLINKFNTYKILKLNKTRTYSIYKNLALLLTTSGSTGSKKFVRISYENIYENTKSIIKYLKIDQSQKTITTMPPFYTYGLSILNSHLFVGASIVVTEMSIVEKLFWNLVKNQKITSFGGVPYFYEILKKIKFHNMTLPYLKYFTQAGGALNKDLIKYFINCSELNNSKFIIMYGQTEATARMTYLPYRAIKKKIGSIGLPIPGGEIILKNTKISKSNKKGEIVYKGKNVTLGYANDYKDLKKTDENNQILFTGDLAKKDRDGYLYITGRKSREVKLHGHRINLSELEAILADKGYKCVCHCFNNAVTIFHVNKNYNNNVLKDLSFITKININSLRLKLLKEFPYNKNGKIAYNKLEGLK